MRPLDHAYRPARAAGSPDALTIVSLDIGIGKSDGRS